MWGLHVKGRVREAAVLAQLAQPTQVVPAGSTGRQCRQAGAYLKATAAIRHPTTMAIITLFTVDVRENEGKPSIVGYAFFPLFLDRDTKEQPETEENTVRLSQTELLPQQRRLPDPALLPRLLPEEAVPLQRPVAFD